MTAFGQYEDDDSGSTYSTRDYKDATDLVVQPVCATGHRTHALTVSDGATEDGTVATEITGTLSSRATAGGGLGTDFEVAGGLQPFTFDGSQSDNPKATHQYTEDGSPPLIKRRPYNVASPTMAVRRLLPVECERLQGFPDDWTNIPWRGKPAPDGPRYKAMGNSFAVPVVRWIGERLDRVAKEKR